MPSLLFLTIHFAIALGAGSVVVASLDRRNDLNQTERLLIAPLIGYAVIYYVVFGVGLVRLDKMSMGGALVALGLVALAGLRDLLRKGLGEFAHKTADVLRQDKIFAGLAILVGVISLTSLLQGMAPPNDYDSLMYHISGPQLDVEMGRIGAHFERAISGVFFYPALMDNQTRLALTLSDAGAAQMTHGMLGILVALLSAAIVRRLGYDRRTAALAACIFIATRVVVWEMGSVEVDVPLAAFAAAAMLCYLILRESRAVGVGILFGLMIGGGILTKYHGLGVAAGFAPVMIYDLRFMRRRVAAWISGPLAAFVMMVPHCLRLYLLTGNPLFPLFNNIFFPGKPDILGSNYHAYGAEGGIIGLVSAPWFLSIEPMRYFDGMVLGLPIFLALVPLLLLQGRELSRWGRCFTVAAVYFFLWYNAFGQQVRFLLPLMPLLSAASAVGAASLWRQCAFSTMARAAFAGLSTVLIAGQSMFVGIYSVVRLPVAVGLMSPLAYHTRTPTLTGANYVTCGYIRDHLRPGDSYLVLAPWVSFYCPQAAALVNYFPDEAKWWIDASKPPAMSLAEFTARFEESNFKYILLSIAYTNRRNLTATETTIELGAADVRFGDYIYPTIAHLTPVSRDNQTAVYDGAAVLAGLKRELAEVSPQSPNP